MNIKSEQEMIEYGKEFAKKILSNSNSFNLPIIIELIGDVGGRAFDAVEHVGQTAR